MHRLRGLLMWEIGGLQFTGRTMSFSVSLVRPQWWQFRINRYKRLLEIFVGPVAFITWYARFRSD